MKKILLILAGLVLLACLALILFLVLRPGLPGPAPTAPDNSTTPAASLAAPGNATLAALLPGAGSAGNATAGNATQPAAAANATATNATAGNATAPGPPPVPHELVAGAYLSQAVANATLQGLREQGLAPALFSRPDDAGQVWWEVNLGRFPDQAAAAAEHAGGVGVVHHQGNLVGLAQFCQTRQVRHVAVHAEHRVRGQELARVVPVLLQEPREVVQVVMAVADLPGPGEQDAIDDTGVVQAVGEDQGVPAGERREQRQVGREARGEAERGLLALELGHPAVQFVVQGGVAGDQAGGDRKSVV